MTDAANADRMEDGDEDYDSCCSDSGSGPFCRHWRDPSDCDEVCANCGHHCCQHGFFDSSCIDCECVEWKESV